MSDREPHYIYNGHIYLRESVRLLINAADSAISRLESGEMSGLDGSPRVVSEELSSWKNASASAVIVNRSRKGTQRPAVTQAGALQTEKETPNRKWLVWLTNL